VRGACGALQQLIDAPPANVGFAGLWEAFKRFAARPILGDPPERVDHDEELMLFECGPELDGTETARAGSYAGLLRQLPAEDEDGDDDRLEELRCEVLFESPQVRLDGHEAIWSDGISKPGAPRSRGVQRSRR
jgi:hypothetical protein